MKKEPIIKKFVRVKGYKFTIPEEFPDDIEFGEVGDCFDHCLLQAVKSKGKYLYCEGGAYVDGRWYHHAWLTDKDGKFAFDPTWAAYTQAGERFIARNVVYRGARLNLSAVLDFVAETEYKSPFANYDKAPVLAKKVYDTAY